tara:strand:+ start:2728 stop:3528 length:801 start_codon:yes stop_codon:yes gene_type:complete
MWNALPVELCRAILFHLSLTQLRLVKTVSRAMATSCRAVLRSEVWQGVGANIFALEDELKTQLHAYRLPLTVSVFSVHFPEDAPCIATVHRLKLARYDNHEKACSVDPQAWVNTEKHIIHEPALDDEHTVITDMCIEVHRVGICGSETTFRQALQEAMRKWGLDNTGLDNTVIANGRLRLADSLWPYNVEYSADLSMVSRMWDASENKYIHEVPLDHLLTRMDIATEVRKGKWLTHDGPHSSQNGFDYCNGLDLMALCRLGSTILL